MNQFTPSIRQPSANLKPALTKRFSLLRLSLVTTLAPFLLAPSLANAGAKSSASLCPIVFSESKIQKLPLSEQETYARYLELNHDGALDSIASSDEILELLNDEDLPVFAQRFDAILQALQVEAKETPVTAQAFYDQVFWQLKAVNLSGKLINKGIEENKLSNKGTLRRLLGDLTFDETREMYMGAAGEGTAFTPESLVGQYLKETGAATRLMQVKDLDTGRYFPEPKLFVAVSEASFPAFLKYFSQTTMMSSFGHGGIYTGGSGYTVWGQKVELRAMSPNTPLPMVILKPSEGERLHRYLELATKPAYLNWDNPLKQPWRLLNAETGKPYVRKGAYSCCTNFIGNLPIGDRLVDEYALPLRQDYGNNPGVPRAVVVGSKLQKWKSVENEDLKNVWTVPGHEQFSSVLGQLEKNVNGEFASPGYVIQTLMGVVSSERAPVIFFFAKDHLAPIPKDPALHFEQPR